MENQNTEKQGEIKEQGKCYKNKMAINIEHFTAPGKYAIDLKMEQIEELLKEGLKTKQYQIGIIQTNKNTKYLRYRTQNK